MAVELLRAELDMALALTGCSSIEAVSNALVRRAGSN
jgi:isopentenyl diphosphate isomerase/L-lactate dehydrogenase-like FMN-dependent dehydrogenase